MVAAAGVLFGCLPGLGRSVPVQKAIWSRARPVWPKGEADTVNFSCAFETDVRKRPGDSPSVLRVTAAYDYRVTVNGAFVGFGPVRGPEGVFHVDTWTLPLADGVNRVAIEAAGYRCNCYYFNNQPSFLQAEIVRDGTVVAATGEDGAFVARPSGRIRKAPRYTGQRTFLDAWRVGGPAGAALPLVEQPAKACRPRPLPYPDFTVDRSYRPVRKERMVRNAARKIVRRRFIEPQNDPQRQQFAPDELETNPFYELQGYDFARAGGDPRTLARGESALFEGDMNAPGFLGLKVRTAGPARVVMAFDEILTEKGELDFTRLGCANVAEWRIAAAGDWNLETFEPYAAKFIRVAVLEGAAAVGSVWVRTYASPLADRASFESSDPALGLIFRAARASFRANAVDGFTDCPTRERAYWTGDTFFTGRAAGWIAQDGSVERHFLGNFLHHGAFDWSQYDSKGVDMSGAIPALYPGGIFWDNFIPNYMMWTILQAEEHVRRYGDRGFLDAARERILGIVDFLEKFRNADGLLENLPGWVFVEWSKANALVQDVNYPSSMMYAAALDAVARLYARPEYAREAAEIRREIVRQSWNGEWFCDNAVRQPDGTLRLSGECTETCQYCAFFFGTATPESHPDLWRRLLDEFGPGRKARGAYPKIWPCNFIFGTCERLELLSRAGRSRQIYSETRDFFRTMAERTGTLWEHLDTRASCCHGFCSIAVEYLFRDILGVRALDRVNTTVRVVPPEDLPLVWCRGRIPVSATETVGVFWRREPGGKPGVALDLPPGWHAL